MCSRLLPELMRALLSRSFVITTRYPGKSHLVLPPHFTRSVPKTGELSSQQPLITNFTAVAQVLGEASPLGQVAASESALELR
jgi:hypothetical protein